MKIDINIFLLVAIILLLVILITQRSKSTYIIKEVDEPRVIVNDLYSWRNPYYTYWESPWWNWNGGWGGSSSYSGGIRTGLHGFGGHGGGGHSGGGGHGGGGGGHH
jgi:hypothetical protein